KSYHSNTVPSDEAKMTFFSSLAACPFTPGLAAAMCPLLFFLRPPGRSRTYAPDDLHESDSRLRQCRNCRLDLDLGTELDDAVGGKLEVVRRVAGVARHHRKQALAPERHAAWRRLHRHHRLARQEE